MNKKCANEMMDAIERALVVHGSEWRRIAPPPGDLDPASGLSEYRYFGKFVLDRTFLLIGLNVDLRREFISVAVGWSDEEALIDVPSDVLRERKGYIEWHRRGMPTTEFNHPTFERSLGGLVKMGVAKKYEAKDADASAIDEIIEDLKTVGVEYWQIMLKRRFGVEAIRLSL